MSYFDDLKGQLDLLPSLLALLEEKSVTRAAERMRVTQPAMSRTLTQLRSAFDDRLLERSGTGMALTPRAEALIPACRNVLDSAKSLFTSDGFDPATSERHFRIAIPDVIALYALPPLLEQFLTEAPDCTLQMISWADAKMPNAQDDLSFVLTTEPSHFPSFLMKRVEADKDVLVHHKPLPKRTDPLSLEHIAVIPHGFRRDPVDDWLGSAGRERLISVEVPYYSMAVELLANSERIAILPKRLARHLSETRGFHWTDLKLDQSPDILWLMHSKPLDQDPASVWIRELILRVFSAL